MLRSQGQSITTAVHLEADLLVLQIDNLVSDEFLFLLKLLNAILVKTEEAAEELQRVLEVLLLLIDSSVTDESLVVSECSDGGSPL